MPVKLHQNGRITPAIRRAIQSSSLSASQLAARHGVANLKALMPVGVKYLPKMPDGPSRRFNVHSSP